MRDPSPWTDSAIDDTCHWTHQQNNSIYNIDYKKKFVTQWKSVSMFKVFVHEKMSVLGPGFYLPFLALCELANVVTLLGFVIQCYLLVSFLVPCFAAYLSLAPFLPQNQLFSVILFVQPHLLRPQPTSSTLSLPPHWTCLIRLWDELCCFSFVMLPVYHKA